MMIRKRNPSRLEPLYDTIVGDGDDETLTGTEGRDLIRGLGGEDVLIGLGGRDRLEGGERADTLTGGKGRDTLIGGKHDDVYRFETVGDSRPGRADTITIFRGGDALDLSAIDADKGTAGNQDFTHVAALTGVAGQLAFSSDGGNGTIVEGDVDGDGVADIRIEISRDDRDTLAGTDGDDTLIGYDEDETMGGGTSVSLGDDLLLGAGGNDSLIGGNENDTLKGGGGNDTLTGGGHFDVIVGGQGDDSIIGTTETRPGPNVDSIEGGEGNDTITAVSQSTIIGGTGHDVIVIQDTVNSLPIVPASGGEGDDTISVVYEGNGGVSRLHILGEGGSDSLAGGLGPDTIEGNDGDDTLRGERGSDLLLGGEGDDQIFSGQKPDTVVGGLGADTLGGKMVTFRYEDILDSTLDNPDLLADLSDADVVDLSAIDADTLTSGDQAFTQVADFTGEAGQLRLRLDGAGDTLIEGDVDGDAIADFLIRAAGDHLDFTGFEF